MDLSRIRHKLQAQAVVATPDSGQRAAVLLPLLVDQQQWHILFIKRADNPQDLHSGQVAFPGGRLLQSENARQAALREANEEIALRADDVEILGRMPDFQSIGGYQVSPWVGLIPWPYAFELQQSEVSKLFTIPVSWLNDASNYRTELRSLGKQQHEVVYYNEYQGQLLWGLTAAITRHFLEYLS